MKSRKLIYFLLSLLLYFILTGCQSKSQKSLEQITLIIKTPPISLGNVPDIGEVEIYDLLMKTAEKFSSQYDKYDVKFEISRYNYVDEQEQLADKYGTDEAADIFFSGSWNIPAYVNSGWLVPLDDIIDEKLREDIDEAIWSQNSIDAHVYTLPFQYLQNTLLVNKAIMEKAGLQKYIPEQDTIAHWSTDDFNIIFKALRDSISNENKFAFMMYAANNQGDSHIMTLLRSYGGTVYDENGNFAVNTPEGIKALEWIKEMNRQGFIPEGAANMDLVDCINLFYNGQLAICVGNLTNFWGALNKGLDIFAANFPSIDGKGYATSSSNGFCVFDNGNSDKIQIAKDFIKFIYTDEELMKYTLGTIPVNHSVIEKYQNEIKMLHAYSQNMSNNVNNIRNNLNWQKVRDVFYLNIRDLLLETKTPAEVAAAIDETCNAALNQK